MVRVSVSVPKKVTDEERELLMKLDSSVKSTTSSGKKSKLRKKIEDTIDDITR